MSIFKIIKRRFKKLFPVYRYRKCSYSQDGEDMVLKSLLKQGSNYKGSYVDVGAHHPFRFSNTAHFYRNGWTGINIESSPDLMKRFKRYRRKDINLNIGISNQKAELTFYVFNEQALNSFNKQLSLQREIDPRYKIVKELMIQTFPLSEILDKYWPEDKKIDFLSIDVEGLDLEVLQSNNWNKYIPDFILVEQEFLDFSIDHLKQDAIYRYLTERNYKLTARTHRTSVFEKMNE